MVARTGTGSGTMHSAEGSEEPSPAVVDGGRADERQGLPVGLDVIGDYLTEVNVTSPTCFQEITQQTGFNVAGMFIDALERAAGKSSGLGRKPA